MPAGAVAKIRIMNAGKEYRTRHGVTQAVRDFSLSVAEGEFVCIVGPSGCGKSTVLRMLAGLTPLTRGEITVSRRHADRPLASIVFQEYGIFPWKTVRENVLFGPLMRGMAAAKREAVADLWLGKVGLRRFANHYPAQLSGGMKQRVSIARAFANDPEVLLMDEPLGALDAQTRVVLQEELLRLWEEEHKTVVYITHSIEEAVLLGDRVELMTAHPGANKAAFIIDLPRPRSIELLGTPEFARVSYAIWTALQEEVLRALEAQA